MQMQETKQREGIRVHASSVRLGGKEQDSVTQRAVSRRARESLRGGEDGEARFFLCGCCVLYKTQCFREVRACSGRKGLDQIKFHGFTFFFCVCHAETSGRQIAGNRSFARGSRHLFAVGSGFTLDQCAQIAVSVFDPRV